MSKINPFVLTPNFTEKVRPKFFFKSFCINPFLTEVPVLQSLKTLENQRSKLDKKMLTQKSVLKVSNRLSEAYL